eukprot:7887142-Alexandrium_andersonii.AAC.1
MAAYTMPAAPAVLPAWPVGVLVALKDVAVEMSLEAVDVLVNRPETLTVAIIDQRVIDGGERDQRSTDAVGLRAAQART